MPAMMRAVTTQLLQAGHEGEAEAEAAGGHCRGALRPSLRCEYNLEPRMALVSQIQRDMNRSLS